MKTIKKQGFKYHKFIKNFGLFALAVVNCVYAALYFSGATYSLAGNTEINADVMYALFGNGLKILDIVYGCLFALATIITLIARHRLAKGFKDGIKIICGLFIYEGVFPFVYTIWGHSITGIKIINVKNIFILLIFLSLAYATLKYYGKREEMFKK